MNHRIVAACLSAGLSLLLSACGQMPISSSAFGGPSSRMEWIVGIPWGSGSTDGIGESARFAGPLALAADPRGGLLIADEYADTIRRADSEFRVTTIAGQPGSGAFRDGAANSAHFDSPSAVAGSADGTLYVADRDNNAIRKITPDGHVTLLAGSPGHSGLADGRGLKARFNSPSSLVVDGRGRLWVADHYNDALRIVSPNGYVKTWPHGIANVDTAHAAATLDGIEHVALAPDGSIVVAGDWGISRIVGAKANRLLALHSQPPGDGPRVADISGLAVRADGTIYISDASQGVVFQLASDGTVKVVAGQLGAGDRFAADGPPGVARLKEPGSLAFDRDGRLFVANESQSVQQILPDGTVRNVLGVARGYHKYGATARIVKSDCDVAVENGKGHVFVVQRLSSEIQEFDADGRHLRQFGRDPDTLDPSPKQRRADGDPSSVRFHYPQDIALGRNDELFVADGGNGIIRCIAADGTVSTLAGTHSSSHRRDGRFEQAVFFRPYRLAFDGHRYLYVLDNSPYIGGGANMVVRQLDLDNRQIATIINASTIITTFLKAYPNTTGWIPTTLQDIAIGPGGRLYVLGEDGEILTWAPGEGLKIMLPPGALLPAGRMLPEPIRDAKGKRVENHLVPYPQLTGTADFLAVDPDGNIYLSDSRANVVLRLDTQHHLDVIAGTPGTRGNVDGPLPGSLEYPQGLSITPEGDLLITAMRAGVIQIRQPQRVHGQRVKLAFPLSSYFRDRPRR